MADELEIEIADDALDPDLDDEAELDEDVDEDELVEDDDLVDDDFATDEVLVDEEDDEDEEEEEAAPHPRARKVAADEDEDDEDVDPDDIEADLSDILQDRMATDDDDEDDEGDDDAPKVSAQRDREFVCESCFLVVNRSQFGFAKNPRCPVGDPDCPSISLIFS